MPSDGPFSAPRRALTPSRRRQRQGLSDERPSRPARPPSPDPPKRKTVRSHDASELAVILSIALNDRIRKPAIRTTRRPPPLSAPFAVPGLPGVARVDGHPATRPPDESAASAAQGTAASAARGTAAHAATRMAASAAWAPEGAHGRTATHLPPRRGRAGLPGPISRSPTPASERVRPLTGSP